MTQASTAAILVVGPVRSTAVMATSYTWSMADESPARITRVVLKNYKSIVSCDVELRPLTILVGPNGSGKSNFVDALRFVQEALTVGLEQAIRNRGNALRILSEGRPAGMSSFSLGIEFRLSDRKGGRYDFEVNVNSDGEATVGSEALVMDDADWPEGLVLFSFSDQRSDTGGSEAARSDHRPIREYL